MKKYGDKRLLLFLLFIGIGVVATSFYAVNIPDFDFPVSSPQPYELSETAAVVSSEELGVVNLNTATSEELQTLPGIGEKTAQAILDYRREHGRFLSRKEIMEVDGIGEKTYEKIRDRLTT